MVLDQAKLEDLTKKVGGRFRLPSLLQRRLGIGYSRAARLIDMMAEEGIVGEYKGSQARETLMTLEEWEAMQQNANQKDS